MARTGPRVGEMVCDAQERVDRLDCMRQKPGMRGNENEKRNRQRAEGGRNPSTNEGENATEDHAGSAGPVPIAVVAIVNLCLLCPPRQ